MESISKSFGRIIRERRKKLRLSQRQIAGLSGKTQSQIARLEAGPRFSSVVQVSRSLGAEIVLVPIRLLPAVRHLLDQHEPGGGSKPAAKLVGNEPEDADEEGRDES
jgi:transcriptional regulator with XRE-family HTH domain